MGLLGFGAAQLAAIGAIALVAFVVRKMSSFGSAMVGIGGLSLLLPPPTLPLLPVTYHMTVAVDCVLDHQ